MEQTLNNPEALDVEQEKDVEHVRERDKLLRKAELMKKQPPWLKYDMKDYIEAHQQEKIAKKMEEAARTWRYLKGPIDSSGGLSSGLLDKNSSAVGDMSNSDLTAMIDPKVGPPPAEGVTALCPNVPQSLKLPASVLGSCTSASGAVLVPSLESHSLGDVIGIQRTSGEQKVVCRDLLTDSKGTSESSGLSAFGRSSGSRPSSSHSSRSTGSPKVVPNKEWKPKPTSTAAAQATENVIIPDDVPLTAETAPKSTPTSNSVSKEDLLKVDKRFSDLQL